MKQQEDIMIGENYYIIHSDDNGCRVLHATASKNDPSGHILFTEVNDSQVTSLQGIEWVYQSYGEASTMLKRQNRETLQSLSVEKLIDLIVYCAEQKPTQSTKDLLNNAEYIGLIKEEIIQRTK